MSRPRRTTRVLALAGALALVCAFLPRSGHSLEAAAQYPVPTEHRTRALPALGALGANFNENLNQVDYGELNSANADWIRGFYTVAQADALPPAQSENLRVIREARGRGLRTILSLQFQKTNLPFPRPGTAEMTAELRRLDRVLPLVLGAVDIVTIGNEPFIESMPGQRDQRLNEFYETVARHVIAARANLCPAPCSTHLYMGALNRLDLLEQRTPAVERYLGFARRTPAIEGVDLHPHVPDQARIQAFLDYTLPRLRPDQTFLVTEFSLVWHWQRHLTDPIPAAFAQRYGYSPAVQVWQVIGEAIRQPFPAQKWSDLLSMSPWFESRKHMLREEMARFRGTGRLAVATYGFRQIPSMTANWSATKTPWLLNSVFANLTVQPRADGTAAPGYAWIDDFRALQ
ncbi:hypothetical protein [Kribbella sp. CA-294648]|uniref:hypothetical protein n=1 Tax=Kribbella sp. CA-294648 TaxID=3239948 RepID=UPI003D94CE62